MNDRDGMNNAAALERRYRRLLAWYPRPFRRGQQEEMLAVLMAGARQGQRRPGPAEAVNLITTGLGMRLRSRWSIVGAVTCAAAVAALGYALGAPKSYAATAAVDVLPVGADYSNSSTGPQTAAVNLDTEARLVASEAVAARAGHLLHTPLAPSQLSREVTVQVPPNSALLDITCHAPTAAKAATCANDFATAYLQNRKSTAIASLRATISKLLARAGPLQKVIGNLARQVSSLPVGSPARGSDEAALAAGKTELRHLDSEVAALTVQRADSKGGVIITAATASSPSG
jgi:capsular polysaccharide biosynthesis protein